MNYNTSNRSNPRNGPFLGATGELLMKHILGRQENRTAAARKHAGFTLMETVLVVAIGLIMTAVATPILQSGMAAFKLRGTVSSITGAIQSTRYQAIVQGIPYQIVFDSAGKTYQINNQPGGAGPFKPVCSVTGAASCPVSLATSGSVALDVDMTLTFSPGGKVTSPNNAAMTMQVTGYGKPTETIKVSSYGNINVTP